MEPAGPGRAAGEHETLTDFAVDEIRKKIVLGWLPPGAKLRVDPLAKELAVSRVPVREAFRELLAEGLAEVYPRRGAVVSEIRRHDVEDGYRMLELMEVMAAERVAATASAETAERMRPHLLRLKELATDPDPLEHLLAHRAFHFEVFSALGPGMLQRTARMMWHASERHINTSARGERLHQAYHEHSELVRFFEEGDTVGAVAMTRMHVAHGCQAALRGLGFAG
ncbi:GntR family transcriptional regulator [Actinomadura darangshiensis]|uniref:GntR family transcriptional regulator n=1 Tax=Actinomadura darangshiensis TaxID=705336 RepID=UPI001A9CE057|nr:GntR family transcriptional regulator [Actinomadura darangshiensis]